MSSWEYQFNVFLRLLTSPQGLLALIGVCVLAALAFSRPWARLLVLALLIWSTTLSNPPRGIPGFNPTLITPLQQLRDNTRAITTACLAILLLPTIAAGKGWRPRLIAAPVIAFFVFQMIFSTMDTVFGEAARGLLGLVIVVMTLFVIGRGVGAGIQDYDGATRVVKAVAAAAALFVLCATVQGIINPNAIKRAGRFYATTANPQFASTTIGAFMPVVAYLIVQRGIGRAWRLAMCSTLGLLIVFLLWTGSRTGLLMSGVGLLMLFRLRLGKFAVAGMAVAVALFIGLQLFGGEISGADRLLSTEDTRTGAWTNMWSTFTSNPLKGTAVDTFGSENSYLWTAARYGLLGFLPLLAAVGTFGLFVLRLQRVRGRLDRPHRLLADLVVAEIAAAGAGAMFEGFLIGQFNVVVFCLLTLTTVGQYVLDAPSVGLGTADGYDKHRPMTPPQGDEFYAPPGEYGGVTF